MVCVVAFFPSRRAFAVETHISIADTVGVGPEDNESHWRAMHPQLNVPPELKHSLTGHHGLPWSDFPSMWKLHERAVSTKDLVSGKADVDGNS